MKDHNENRPGYKKTKVGWIPEEWDVQPIGRLCSFSSGNGFRPKDWSSKGLPIIRIQNLNGKQEFNYFSGKPDPSWLVLPGDLLFAWAWVKGVSFGPTLWPGPKGVLNQHIYKVHPFAEVDKSWLFRSLFRATEMVEAKAHGFKSSLLHVHKKDITGLRLPFPPLPEQKKIAEILSNWDEAIERTRELINAKKHRKKALMQKLLTGKNRLWESTESWNEMSMKELFTRVTRNLSGNPSRVLSITATVGFVDQESKFSRLIAGKNINNYILLKRNEFAYNKGNSKNYPQGCIYKLEEYDEGAVPNVYYCFKAASEKCSQDFYKFYFEAGLLNDHLAKVINTGVRNDGLLNLHAEDFFKAPILVPPLKEQEAIAKILHTATEEIHHLKMKLAALEKQKRGLMQKLLTGEIRVKS